MGVWLKKEVNGKEVDLYEVCLDRIMGRKFFVELKNVCFG